MEKQTLMQQSKSNKTHAERGQGRKSISMGKSPVLQLRVSQELKDKVQTKGAQWARETLEKAE